jgi:hypothetical protein
LNKVSGPSESVIFKPANLQGGTFVTNNSNLEFNETKAIANSQIDSGFFCIKEFQDWNKTKEIGIDEGQIRGRSNNKIN